MASSPAAPEGAGLKLDIDGAVATITLHRPERRNAMTPAMWRGLAVIGEELPPEVRVVVVRGDGPSFSAGIDLRLFTADGIPGEELTRPSDPGFEDAVASYQAGYLWLRRPEIVSIAAVHGYAIGGGFQLALACDLRVCADNAIFCMKEPALGLVPDLTGTKPLVDIAGLPRALEICLTARNIDAAEARALGLAQQVVPAAELDAAVASLASALCTSAADTARATKELLSGAPGRSLAEQSAAEIAMQARLQRSRGSASSW
jgi:enoyl-CoA hydratase/carnithine racemase